MRTRMEKWQLNVEIFNMMTTEEEIHCAHHELLTPSWDIHCVFFLFKYSLALAKSDVGYFIIAPYSHRHPTWKH